MNIKFCPKNYTILLVEDDQDQQQYYINFLEEEGFHVFPASTAREALTLMRRNHVDIIVSDLKMPGVDGVELIEYLRKTHITPQKERLPIILFTSSTEVNEDMAIYLGASRFCEKKNFQKDLVGQIRSLLE